MAEASDGTAADAAIEIDDATPDLDNIWQDKYVQVWKDDQARIARRALWLIAIPCPHSLQVHASVQQYRKLHFVDRVHIPLVWTIVIVYSYLT